MLFYRMGGKCNISGERIRRARMKAGMSQEMLAARLQTYGLQFGQMAISRMETGKRIIADFELLYLAQALGVTTDWLLGKEKNFEIPLR